ncbi:hypothetical protein PsorP6_014551 [Peronosclerospora sorghi]|uniref:Uncharacterized protein n=1 Tax=Peronosclerospora sorghi TaxID=230839 RepID=A0ACC0VTU3_9STRA|nr:hypothetical protein PsorP6_014551 [Peronosclerospora sorghi]
MKRALSHQHFADGMFAWKTPNASVRSRAIVVGIYGRLACKYQLYYKIGSDDQSQMSPTALSNFSFHFPHVKSQDAQSVAYDQSMRGQIDAYEDRSMFVVCTG